MKTKPMGRKMLARKFRKYKPLVLSAALGLVLLLVAAKYTISRTYSPAQLSFRTAQGIMSHTDVEEILYKPLGYQYASLSEPIATLKKKTALTCARIFEEWLVIAIKRRAKQKPPNDIPAEYIKAFTMNGLASFRKWYYNENFIAGSVKWPRKLIDDLISAKKPVYEFREEGVAVEQSTKYYNISGMTGFVVGSPSASAWIEVLCLRNGAAEVITVDYLNITTDHPKIAHFFPFDMPRIWNFFHEKIDFVVSFSIVEHSGLGRYGDPLDPIGDLREMRMIRCYLKKGGLLFLGVPTGFDKVLFNARRVYGRIRLPLLFEGYELLNVFYGKDPVPRTLTKEYLEDASVEAHHVFVLRKL